MARVYAVVEGPTEEQFVKQVLGPYLAPLGAFVTPILIGKARSRRGIGGNVTEQRVVDDVTALLKMDGAANCTTFLDYYGIDNGFPGKEESRSARAAAQKAEIVEAAFRQKVLDRFDSSFLEKRFLPYIHMHEYEGLLFSDTGALAQALGNESLADSFSEILKQFSSPEEINDDYDKKPSRRIAVQFPGYQKTYHGILAARRIGLECMKTRCGHFRQWCESLEKMGD